MKKSLKILVFTRYSGLGASSRLRINQYLPYFKDNNLSSWEDFWKGKNDV